MPLRLRSLLRKLRESRGHIQPERIDDGGLRHDIEVRSKSLCETCIRAIERLANERADSETDESDPDNRTMVVAHHKDTESLLHASSGGCFICCQLQRVWGAYTPLFCTCTAIRYRDMYKAVASC